MDIPFHPIEGSLVKMEPLMPEHKEEVRAAIDCDPTAWSILLVNPMGAGFEEYWSANCGAPLTERLPYVVRRLSDDQVVGVSTYFMAKAKHGGVEIGATFLRPDVRASFVNPETKLLMLGHAFNSGAVARPVHGRCTQRAQPSCCCKVGRSKGRNTTARHPNLDRTYP